MIHAPQPSSCGAESQLGRVIALRLACSDTNNDHVPLQQSVHIMLKDKSGQGAPGGCVGQGICYLLQREQVGKMSLVSILLLESITHGLGQQRPKEELPLRWAEVCRKSIGSRSSMHSIVGPSLPLSVAQSVVLGLMMQAWAANQN